VIGGRCRSRADNLQPGTVEAGHVMPCMINHTCTNTDVWNSGATNQNLIKFSQHLQKWSLTNMLQTELWYSNTFQNATCQINDDRQIAAVSRHIFKFCSLKLWTYWTDLHQNFTWCRGISTANIQNYVAFYLEMPEQRVKTVNFDVCEKASKLIGYHINVSTTAKIISVL